MNDRRWKDADGRPRRPVRALLTDGRIVTIRPLCPGDLDQLLRLHAELPERDQYLRFFTAHPMGLDRLFMRVVEPQDVHRLALGGFLGDALVGAAHFEILHDPTDAEVALAVDHRRQARGLGTLLLEHLASAARDRGVQRFLAEVLRENAAMIQVFRDASFPTTLRPAGDTYEVTIELVGGYLEAVGERERRADIASLQAILRPRSVAVVGASQRPDAIGNALLTNLKAGGFDGTLVPVNPHATEVAGLPTVASARDLPDDVDLAVICVPAAAVPQTAESCGRHGVRALVVISSGLTDHTDHARALMDVVRRHGMRLVGPNCLGVVNTEPAVRLNATFARGSAGDGLVPAGQIGVVTQSGGVGIALLERFAKLGLGVSTMVSTGDKYDVSSNDMLLWWQRDEATDLAVVYVESFGNPRKFAKLARALSERKPVLAVRTAGTRAAQRAAESHTAARATPTVSTDALFGQAGVIPVDNLSELVGVAAALSWQPRPSGNRTAVIGNAGGIGVLASDACVRNGLVLPDLAERTRTTLATLLPTTASIQNPVDTTAGISDGTFLDCVRTVIDDPDIDAVLVLAAPTAVTDPAPGLADTAAGSTKPVVVGRIGQAEVVSALHPHGPGRSVPCFGDPSLAAVVLASAARYGVWRTRPVATVPDLPGIDIAAARDMLRRYLRTFCQGGWLAPGDTEDLLGYFGLPVLRTIVAGNYDVTAEAFRELHEHTPAVALKAVVPGLQHKSSGGGVVLNLRDEKQLRQEYDHLRDRFGDRLEAVIIQAMAEPGRELLVGVHHDPTFGPLVAFGLGGVDTDLIGDRAYRLVPLSNPDATDMLGALRCSAALFGPDAHPRLATGAIVDVLLRIGRMAELLPDVAELDLNPVTVTTESCWIVDARIRIQPAEPTDPYLRRLRS